MNQGTKTILCLACYFKGGPFLERCKERGWNVLLVTSESLRNEAWPRGAVDEFFYMKDAGGSWKLDDLLLGVGHIAQSVKIDRVVALDDYDLEKAAMLREQLRIPGMGETRMRFFRDKLAMRFKAFESGVRVPPFIAAINNGDIDAYLRSVSPPWVLKPRMQASATGIRKITTDADAWDAINGLGDKRIHYLLEQFIPGDIFHVDSIVFNDAVIFARVSRYRQTPMKIAHEGGIFATHTVDFESPDHAALLRENDELLRALGHRYGVAHSEFIKAASGEFFFLETAARVGGAHIVEMIEAASGVNLWREWASIETLGDGDSYDLPGARTDHAGLVVCLARQERPDLSAYNNPEVVWKMNRDHHAGLIVASPSIARVKELIDEIADRFQRDFMAVAPLPDRPSA